MGIRSVRPSRLEHPDAHVELARARRRAAAAGAGRRTAAGPGARAAGGRPAVRRPRRRPAALLVEQGGQAAGQHLLHGRVVVVAGHGGHLEVAVVALLGQAVLEHHHRARRSRCPAGGSCRSTRCAAGPRAGRSSLLERLEGPGPAVVVRGPLQPVADEGLAGVVLAPSRAGPRFGPRSGTRTATGPPRRSVQVLPITASRSAGMVGTRTWRGTPDAGVGVDVDQEPLHQLGRRSGPRPCRRTGPSARPPCPTGRGRPGRPPPARPRPGRARRGPRGGRAPSGARRRRPGPPRACPAASTARSKSRAAEASLHGRLELPLERRRCRPPRKVTRSATRPVVLLVVDGPHARARAPLDVEEQAGPAQALVVAELGVRAGPHRERPQQQVEGAPGWPRRSGRGRSTGPRCACGPGPRPAGATRRSR